MILKKFFALFFGIMIFFTATCSANEILASTADENNPWSLSLIKTDNNEYAFLVLNFQTEQGAIIPYSRDYYNFYMGESPFIFIMAVPDSPKDVDYDLGEWRDEFHLIPVYALFNYSNGAVNLESYLSSCNGLSASHYQAHINSPYHLKLAEIFLTHMPALHKVVESGGVTLP